MTLKVWWFPEYTPWEQLVFDDLVNIVQKSYQKLGFVHIETPAVERNDVLLKWWENASNQVFGLYGMAQWADDLKWYGLRFDLTVPFTRYVLDHIGELVFPFKRYQVQPVWRGERSQKGRFNQFYQADIDVIWRNNENLSYIYYDAETLFVINSTLQQIRAKYLKDSEWIMHVNNRKTITWFFNYLTDSNQEQITSLYKLFDDYYKIWEKKFEDWLISILWDNDKVELVIKFISAKIHELDDRFGQNELYIEWVKELSQVFDIVNTFNIDWSLHFYYDPFIVRWLDYYTWTVFEVLDRNNISLWSISGGGRYDNLAQSLDSNAERLDWVWWSIGISRLAHIIIESLKITTQTHTQYLFINFDITNKDIINLANQFISEWKNIEIYPESIKLAKQFSYADKKWIPYVVILWDWELEKWIYIIKDLATGESKEYML